MNGVLVLCIKTIKKSLGGNLEKMFTDVLQLRNTIKKNEMA